MATFEAEAGERRAPSGFTILELLIVLAVVSLLATLALTALNAAQERSRSVSCLGNLKNLGTAVLSFTSSHDHYPSAVTARVRGPLATAPAAAFHNYASSILPYLDAKAAFDAYNVEEDFCSTDNRRAAEALFPSSRCPSAPVERPSAPTSFDPGSLLSFLAGDAPETAQAVAALQRSYTCEAISGPAMDYTVVVGVASEAARALGRVPSKLSDGRDAPYPLEGMFPLPSSDPQLFEAQVARLAYSSESFVFERRLRPGDVTDGTHRTIMLAEIAGRPQHWVRGKPREGTSAVAGSVWSHPQNVVVIGGSAERSLIQESNDQALYSFHPGYCNVLFADGHGDSMDRRISPSVLVALVTPRDGDATE